MSLLTGRRYGHVGLWMWVMPSLILLTGLYVMLKPLGPLHIAMTILGWCMMVYGIVEMVNTIKFYRDRKQWLEQQEQPQLDTTTFEEIKE
jgi:uncharacterized membrane protein HdeD (DUF308 family)